MFNLILKGQNLEHSRMQPLYYMLYVSCFMHFQYMWQFSGAQTPCMRVTYKVKY
jgi:hypothetical protein